MSWKDIKKGLCVSCGKNRLVNTENKCFWCWDNEN